MASNSVNSRVRSWDSLCLPVRQVRLSIPDDFCNVYMSWISRVLAKRELRKNIGSRIEVEQGRIYSINCFLSLQRSVSIMQNAGREFADWKTWDTNWRTLWIRLQNTSKNAYNFTFVNEWRKYSRNAFMSKSEKESYQKHLKLKSSENWSGAQLRRPSIETWSCCEPRKNLTMCCNNQTRERSVELDILKILCCHMSQEIWIFFKNLIVNSV